jgi:hypothetical protein
MGLTPVAQRAYNEDMSNRIDTQASQLCPGDYFMVSPGARFMRSEKTDVTVDRIERRTYKTIVHYNGSETLSYMHNDIIKNVRPAA